MMSNSFLCSPQASRMLSFRSKHVWLLTKHVANRGCNISETLTCAHHNVCSIAIRCFIRHYHFLLRSIESRNKTIRTQTVLLPMQNIIEANMFLFGRACVSGTLWCQEIQKTFISKAGWAAALPWRNIWIDGIRPSTVLKNIESCLIFISVDRICMLHIF